jgi:hypothetical protein
LMSSPTPFMKNSFLSGAKMRLQILASAPPDLREGNSAGGYAYFQPGGSTLDR